MRPYCVQWETDENMSPLCYRDATWIVFDPESGFWEPACNRHVESFTDRWPLAEEFSSQGPISATGTDQGPII